jgi:hypothetical protein
MTANAHCGVIRVAVVVESLVVPRWVEWAVARIDAADAFDLVAVVPRADRSPSGPRHTVYRLYEWLDRRVFGSASAMHAADLSPIASGRATVAGPLDVVVAFLPAERATWDGPTPRHGIWAVAPMDDGRPASAPDRFWELHGRGGTAGATVVALDRGLPRVIAEDSARADPLSLTRTRDSAAWTSARLVLRCLRLLQRDGAPPPARHALPPRRELPPPAVTAGHAAATAARGVAAKARKAVYSDEWFVAVRARSADGQTQPVYEFANPRGHYLGDPFPIEVDGRHFVFVEDYSYAAGRGTIAVSEAGPGDSWSPPRTVLERDYHLSYPFVFEHEGAIYMLPETGEAGRIELHRAVAFPDEWRLERILLDGLTAVDATLHAEDGHVWLFANVMEGREDRGHLWLFFSSSLNGEWRPHPRNPIVTNPGSARPAGRLFRRGGILVRPSQDCLRGYGRAVVLNRVDVLSPSEYRETPFDRIEPTWLSGLEGTHTYTFDSRYECLDGYRHVRRLPIRPGASWRAAANSR